MAVEELFPDLEAWRRQRILIVDDDEQVLRTLGRILQKEGFVIMLASDGQKALDMAKEHSQIDLLITDIVMRGINGVELAARLKWERPDMPVLFTSGYTQQQIGTRYKLPENSAFLEKPWTPDDIKAEALRLIGPKHPNIAD
jgi:two-component system, cell cycle sensor histidine kinase and response regulator CckA